MQLMWVLCFLLIVYVMSTFLKVMTQNIFSYFVLRSKASKNKTPYFGKIDKYSHDGILYTGGSICPKEYLIVILEE